MSVVVASFRHHMIEWPKLHFGNSGQKAVVGAQSELRISTGRLTQNLGSGNRDL